MASSLTKLVSLLYFNPLVERIFHTSIYCLKRELRGCRSVLDLGCGPHSGLQLAGVPRSLGVDAFLPYLKTSAAKGLHSRHVQADLRAFELAPRSFDAVIMVEVLEHLSEEDGLAVLQKAERWARKRIIVTTPNGYLPQQCIDGNPYQVHRSGWSVERMRRLGYRAHGMAGWRALRSENRSTCTGDPDSIFCTIRWRPAWFWMLASELTQLVTYYRPRLAFEVFYVRDLDPGAEGSRRP